MEPYYESKKQDGNLSTESDSADSGKDAPPQETADGVGKALEEAKVFGQPCKEKRQLDAKAFEAKRPQDAQKHFPHV